MARCVPRPEPRGRGWGSCPPRALPTTSSPLTRQVVCSHRALSSGAIASDHSAPLGLDRNLTFTSYKHRAPNGAEAPGCNWHVRTLAPQARRAVMFIAPCTQERVQLRRSAMAAPARLALDWSSSICASAHVAPLGLNGLVGLGGYKHPAPNGAKASGCNRHVRTPAAQAQRAVMFMAPRTRKRVQLRRSAMAAPARVALDCSSSIYAAAHAAPMGLNGLVGLGGYKHPAPNGAEAPGRNRHMWKQRGD
jgi:hypothetical protein